MTYEVMPEDDFIALVNQVSHEITKRHLNDFETDAPALLAERFPGETWDAPAMERLAVNLFQTCLCVPDFMLSMAGALETTRMRLKKGTEISLEALHADVVKHYSEVSPTLGAAVTPEVVLVAVQLLLGAALDGKLSDDFGSEALNRVFMAMDFLDLKPDSEAVDREVQAHRDAHQTVQEETGIEIIDMLNSIMSDFIAGMGNVPRRKRSR